MIRATVTTTSPVTVKIGRGDRASEPVDGYPAHPAGRPPQPGDECVVDYDERRRLWILAWKA